MAVTKEAIAIILDVGKAMQDEKEGLTRLEEAKRSISMIVQRKIISESKDEIALILFGISDTANELTKQYAKGYADISVIQDLQLASWELLKFISEIKATDISSDFIRDNALLTAINLLQSTKIGKKFLSRRILFISCFDGYIYSNKIDEVCEELKKHKIELNVIGPVAFPTEDVKNGTCTPGFHGECIFPEKIENSITKILCEVNGESYSFNDILPTLINHQKKKVQHISWNANLEIVGTSLVVPISVYVKAREDKPKSWKKAYAFKPNAKIEHTTTYHIKDEHHTSISKDDIITGYRYGTDLVPFSDEFRAAYDYQSGEKGICVLGFTKVDYVQRSHFVDEKAMYIFGQKNRELAGVILAPFIHALHELNMNAIVRYVHSPRDQPRLGALIPRIKDDYECLIFVTLTFLEDTRHLHLEPFDKDPKYKPSEEQLNAVDDLITAMDLSAPIDSEDPEEIINPLDPQNTVNPYLQHFNHCLQFRALNPDKPLPAVEPHILSVLNPSPILLKRAEEPIKRIQSLFNLKETAPKKQEMAGSQVSPNRYYKYKKAEEAIKKELMDLIPDEKVISDAKLVDAVTDKIVEVGSVNPVRDFQYLINNKVLPFNDVCQQMMDVVVKFLQDNAHLRMYHSKILSICKEFRSASLKEGNSVKYNSFMTNLQNVLLECDEELWNKIRNEKIGLISKKEIPTSAVSAEQAEMFLEKPSQSEDKSSLTVIESFDTNEDDEYNNLLEQL